MSRTHDAGTVYAIGVDAAKELLYGRLRIETPGPGYVHFPVGKTDQEYFAQLTAEKVQTKYKLGRPYRLRVPTRKRNEALDCAILALCSRMALRIRLDAFRDPPPAPPVEQPDELEGGDEGGQQRIAADRPPTSTPPAALSSGVRHSAFERGPGFIPRRPGWLDRGRW